MNSRLLLVVALAPLAVVSCKKGLGSDFEGAITMHVHSRVNDSDLVVKTKGGKMRFEAGAPGGYMLFDPTANTVTMVNDGTKTYSQIDFSSPSAPQANTSPETAQIEKSGKHEKVAGVDCEDWTVHDGGKRSEVCVAQGIAFFDMASLKSGHGSGGLDKELRDKKLFPLRDVEYDASGQELSRMEVTKVERRSLDGAEFSVPKGYSRLSLPKP